jgi:hypothetical protein
MLKAMLVNRWRADILTLLKKRIKFFIWFDHEKQTKVASTWKLKSCAVVLAFWTANELGAFCGLLRSGLFITTVIH